MNARDNTPLTIRDRIKAHLGSVEQASATVIASAIGEASTPSRVVKELNAMRTDALVECEQRGKKKELVYWLAVPVEAPSSEDAPAAEPELPALPHNFRPGTRKAQVAEALKPGVRLTVRQMCAQFGVTRGVLDPVIDALFRSGHIKREKHDSGDYVYFRGRGTPHQSPDTVVSAPAAGGDTDSETDVSREEMPPADPALLASANRMLSERLAGVAHVLRGSGLPALADIDDGEDLQPHVAAISGAYQMARSELHACEQIIDRASALCASSGYNNFCLSDRVAGITDELSRLRHRLSAVDAELDATVEALAHVVSNGSDIDPADIDLGELVTEAGKQMNDLRQQLEALMRGRSYAANAAGYVMIASKRKPRRYLSKDKACEAAKSAVRAGAQRAEVFPLAKPIGRAVKGAEWKPL